MATSIEQINVADWEKSDCTAELDELEVQFKRLAGDFTSMPASTDNVVAGPDKRHTMKKDGWLSWIACFCAFSNQLLIFGTLNVYSLFLIKFQKELHCSTGEGAWLGSMTMGLMKLFGPLSSSLIMRLGNRRVMMLGAFLCGAAILGSSFSPDFKTLFGTLSLPFALGAAFTITPAMMIPVDYFNKYQTVAMGIVAAGSSIGTLILAPIMQMMLDKWNWRWTFRIFSVFLFGLVILNGLVRPRKRQNPMMYMKKPIIRSIIQDLDLWKNRVFSLWVLATAISYFGYQIPNILLSLYIFAVIRGFLDGAHVVMLPMLTSSMVGASKALLGWGYMAGAISICYVIGPPLAGFIRDQTGNYNLAFTIAGLPLIASGLLLFLLPWAKRTGKSTNILSVVSKVPVHRTPSSVVETSSSEVDTPPMPERKKSALGRFRKAFQPKHQPILDTKMLIAKLEELPQRNLHTSKDQLGDKYNPLDYRCNKCGAITNASGLFHRLPSTSNLETPTFEHVSTPTVSLAAHSTELLTSRSVPHALVTGHQLATIRQINFLTREVLRRSRSHPNLKTIPYMEVSHLQGRYKRRGNSSSQPEIHSVSIEKDMPRENKDNKRIKD